MPTVRSRSPFPPLYNHHCNGSGGPQQGIGDGADNRNSQEYGSNLPPRTLAFLIIAHNR